jgi:copper(I)-binding protein
MLVLTGTSDAHQIKTKTLTIMHPWIHAAESGASGTQGYVAIRNTGADADRLIGASLDGAADAMVMQPVPGSAGGECRPANGIEIAPGATLELKPGQGELKFGKLTKSQMRDIYSDGVLRFAKAGAIKVEFFVDAPKATSSADVIVADCAKAAVTQ